MFCLITLRAKDLLKSLKLEGKLERKLEKLEHKTKKIKEKKLALLTKSSDSEAGQSSSRSHSYHHCEKEDDLLQMDASPVNAQSVVPHMLGGEIYLHQWEVMNTGKLPWTSKVKEFCCFKIYYYYWRTIKTSKNYYFLKKIWHWKGRIKKYIF